MPTMIRTAVTNLGSVRSPNVGQNQNQRKWTTPTLIYGGIGIAVMSPTRLPFGQAGRHQGWPYRTSPAISRRR
jgi:hypothetical protein